MATAEITFKLNKLIRETSDWTEVETTYLFVQIRKLLDHVRNSHAGGKYQHLRFYCDWVVHIDKDRLDVTTLDFLKDFEDGMKKKIGSRNHHAPGPINFAYFESMQAEIIEFLETQNIEFKPFFEDESWINIICSLVKVLENQPINIKPSYGMLIKSMEFQLSAPRTCWLRATFNEPLVGDDGKEYQYFDLKNAY